MGQGLVDQLALVHHDAGLLDRRGSRRLDPVQHERVGDLLDQVEDIVEAADQRVDVLAIEGRNEGVLEPMANVVADLVAPMFGISKLAGTALDRVVVLEHRFEQPRGAEDVGGILDEQIEESLFAGNESHDRLAPLAGRAKSTSSRIGGGRRFAPHHSSDEVRCGRTRRGRIRTEAYSWSMTERFASRTRVTGARRPRTRCARSRQPHVFRAATAWSSTSVGRVMASPS